MSGNICRCGAYPNILAAILLHQIDQVGAAGDELRPRIGSNLAHRVGDVGSSCVLEIDHDCPIACCNLATTAALDPFRTNQRLPRQVFDRTLRRVWFDARRFNRASSYCARYASSAGSSALRSALIPPGRSAFWRLFVASAAKPNGNITCPPRRECHLACSASAIRTGAAGTSVTMATPAPGFTPPPATKPRAP